MALKTSVLEILSSLLSPNTAIRVAAEERRRALEVMTDYSTVLLQIVREIGLEADAERLMAAVLFRQCVTNHWSAKVEIFLQPEIGDTQKDIIRRTLPSCLRDPNSSVQTHICAVLAIIALSDYPEQWSSMPSEMLQRPHSCETDYAATLSFIETFVLKAYPCQLVPSIDTMFQFLFDTFSINGFNNKMKADTVRVTGEIMCVLFQRVPDADVAKYSAAMKKFCDAFCTSLLVILSKDSDEVQLSFEILNAYTMMLNNIPQSAINALSSTLPTVWKLLILSAEEFDQLLTSESGEPSHGYPCFYSLGYSIFDMLYVLLRTNPGRDFLTPILSDLLYYMILYMGIPKETEALWMADSNAWFSAEFEELYTSPSMRNKAKRLLKVLVTKFVPGVFLDGLWVAVEKHIQVCKVRFQSYGWRIVEAIMYAMGSISKFVVRQHSQNMLFGFPIIDYLTQWVRYAETCPVILTAARIMWVGGRYITILDENNAAIYLKITTNNLVNNSTILRHSAIRAFHWIVTLNKNHKYDIQNRIEIVGLLINSIKLSQGQIVQIGLTALGELISTAPSIISLIQEPLIVMIRDFVGTTIITPEVIYCSRGLISQLYSEIETKTNFENTMLQYFETVFNNIKFSSEDTFVVSGVCCRSIQLINSMIISSPLPLNPRLINIGFYGVYGCIMVCVDDDNVLLNSIEAIRSLISKTSIDLAEFRSRDGTNGLDIILVILKMILTFNKMNYAPKEIAHLCITVIQSLNPLPTSVAHLILQCTLSILQMELSINLHKNVFTIVSFLFRGHIDPVINYLALMPGPRGENGLNFVLNRWLNILSFNYEDRFQTNLYALSFARIIEQAVVKKDPRFSDIMIIEKNMSLATVDLLKDSTHVLERVINIPVLLKLIKILVNLFSLECSAVATHAQSSFQLLGEKTEGQPYIKASDSDDGDDDFYVTQFDTSYLNDDPVYNLNLSEFIGKFFNSLSGNSHFCRWLELLSPHEKETVRSFGINV